MTHDIRGYVVQCVSNMTGKAPQEVNDDTVLSPAIVHDVFILCCFKFQHIMSGEIQATTLGKLVKNVESQVKA